MSYGTYDVAMYRDYYGDMKLDLEFSFSADGEEHASKKMRLIHEKLMAALREAEDELKVKLISRTHPEVKITEKNPYRY